MAADMTRLQGEVAESTEIPETDVETLLIGFLRSLMAENGMTAGISQPAVLEAVKA